MAQEPPDSQFLNLGLSSILSSLSGVSDLPSGFSGAAVDIDETQGYADDSLSEAEAEEAPPPPPPPIPAGLWDSDDEDEDQLQQQQEEGMQIELPPPIPMIDPQLMLSSLPTLPLPPMEPPTVPQDEHGNIQFTNLLFRPSFRPAKRPKRQANVRLLEGEQEQQDAGQSTDLASLIPDDMRDLLQPAVKREADSDSYGEESMPSDDSDYTPHSRSRPRKVKVEQDVLDGKDWEANVVYPRRGRRSAGPSSAASRKVPRTAKARNAKVETDDWVDQIVWKRSNQGRRKLVDFLQVDDWDQKLQDNGSEEQKPVLPGIPYSAITKKKKDTKDPLNISNDGYYEIAQDYTKAKIRQTFGSIEVAHAYPAVKLQLPFYKTRLSKNEARAFHRPALTFPTNVALKFTRLRSGGNKSRKKRQRLELEAGPAKPGMGEIGTRTTSDLSIRDGCDFILTEFSEEYPYIISNYGMGAAIVNYYRKTSVTDESVPKSELGEPFVLEPTDESPFMKFGFVEPGQTVPTYYNNLVRAPMFKHDTPSTDFIVCRNTSKGESKYFIREIQHTFVVGQNFPVNEVPGPHARKIAMTIRDRLRIIAFKLVKHSPGNRIKIGRMLKYFTDQNELQMRQRLKEFMEFHRKNEHRDHWRLRSPHTIPSPEEMIKILSPESVVLNECMYVGLRHLEDSGYRNTKETEKHGEEEEAKLDIEQKLAPWIATKNFLNAMQGKAYIALHGEGDPSSRGEALSFARVSMKGRFLRAGEELTPEEASGKTAHSYNVAKQNAVYRSEIIRIWKAQYNSLANVNPPTLSDEETHDEGNTNESTPRFNPLLDRQRSIPSGEASPILSSQIDIADEMSEAGTLSNHATAHGQGHGHGGGVNHKVLKIKRFSEGEWQTEIIRNPAVISAYVRKRQVLEQEDKDIDILEGPTGDAERDLRYRAKLEETIAALKRNQDRRLQRKNARLKQSGEATIMLDRPMKEDTRRRCGNCGQVGHMKTNRKCPRWEEFNSGPVGMPELGAVSVAENLFGVGIPSLSATTHVPVIPSPLHTVSAKSPSTITVTSKKNEAAPRLKISLSRR